MKTRYRVNLDDFERRIVIKCMMEMRNGLLAQNKDTTDINEIMLKIIDAPRKRD